MSAVLRFIFVFILLFFSYLSFTQNKRFHHITSENGLSQSEVYCFLKDSRGFMWFGTVDGLNQYDGKNIKIFNTDRNNKNSLSNNTVRSLVEDRFGRIWIGTDDGLNIYNPITETIKQIIPVSAINQKLNINTLLIYDDYLYLGTGNGLFRIMLKNRFEGEDDVFLQRIVFSSKTRILNNNILNLVPSSLGGFWMQTSSRISRLIVESKTNKAVIIETPFLEPSFNFFSIVEDNFGNLWSTSFGKGLIRLNLTNKKKSFYDRRKENGNPSSLKCSELGIDKNGNLWVGTLDNGINFISADQLTRDAIEFQYIQHNPVDDSSLNSNLIRTLYVSNDDVVWIGTIGSGINYYNSDQKNFNHLDIHTATTNKSNFIRAVYAISEDKIWAGTHSNGLYEIDRNTDRIKKIGFDNKNVFYITKYEEDKFFVCTDNGLYLIEIDENSDIIKTNSAPTNASFFITKGANNFYWLATYQGLFRLSVINDQIILDDQYSLTNGNSNLPNNCRVLYYDLDSNKLFVGTEGEGLHILTLDQHQNIIDDANYKRTDKKGTISNNYIRSIIKDRDNHLWIGTYEGLNKIINNNEAIFFEHYTKKEGLPNNMINSIVEDNDGAIWIGTNHGLSKMDKSHTRFLNFFESDGIESNEFSEHTVFKSVDGEIFMGGINGIISFRPEEILTSRKQPQTTITNFYINEKRVYPNQIIDQHIPLKKGIAISDTIILKPNQNNISFDFSSMLYPNMEKIRFAFQLEGFNDQWDYTDENTSNAKYTNLDYGKYLFKVKSTNSDGLWEDAVKEIFIHIETPFVYSWYAITLYIFVLILVLIYSSYYSIIRYTTKNKLLLEQEHHQKVQSLNQLRTQFFINISHDLRTPLTLIKGPLDSILKDKNLDEKVQDKLQLVKRNVKRLNYLVEQLLDVRRSEKEKLSVKLKQRDIVAFSKKELSHFSYAIHTKGLKYTIESDTPVIQLEFDAAMLSKVYFNLISNALKYTNLGEINIDIQQVHKKDFLILSSSKFHQFVKIEVRDSGKGIAKDQMSKIFTRFYQEDNTYGKGYGIGLSHTYQLIEAHEGYIEAMSKEGVGTTIRFFIPNRANEGEQQNTAVLHEDDIFRDQTIKTVYVSPKEQPKTAKTILVVEDNMDMRSYLQSELSSEYKIIEAEDGQKGLTLAQQNDVDLIVSDVMMPNMDGITFCNRIKSDIKTSHIPVILLTAKVDKDAKYQGFEIGADDYIPKPFEIDYLSLRIRTLLKSREELRKVFQKQGISLKPSSVTVNSIDEKFLTDLMTAIEKGIPDSDFSVSSLESDLGMSHSNFYRKVKSLTGKSGKEILNEMRMKRAKQVLLDNKKIRIDEVAYMVGFSNPKYFGKSFKEIYGIAPSEMKKKSQK